MIKEKNTNKKSQIFAAGLAFIMLIAMGLAFYTFINTTGKIKTTISVPENLSDMYTDKNMFNFYAKECAKISAEQTFYKIAGNPASGTCSIFSNHIIFSDTCKPSTSEIEKRFVEEFDANFACTKNYQSSFFDSKNIAYEASFVNKEINLQSNSIIIPFSDEKGYASYNGTYTFNPSFSLKLSSTGLNLEDFSEIYSKAKECKNKNGKDAQKIKGCMIIEGWDVEVSLSNPYLLFDLSSKQRHNFENAFDSISLKFGFEA